MVAHPLLLYLLGSRDFAEEIVDELPSAPSGLGDA